MDGHAVDADVSVQGNLLAGPRVVADAMAAFRAAAADSATTLADRLLLALEAGAAAGGDVRCPGQTALSAFLIVAGPDDRRDAQHLRLYVNGQPEGGANPVVLLRQRYAEWRRLLRGYEAGGAGGLEANAVAALFWGNAWIGADADCVWPSLPWSQHPDFVLSPGGLRLVARRAACL